MPLRPGWTLHEMLISLTVTGGIFVLAANAAVGHLRFVRGTGELVAIRAQLGHAAGITSQVLRSVTSVEDILVARDSVAEVMATYGAAFACESDTGRLVVPAPAAGSPLGVFGDTPREGDALMVLIEDDSGAVWIRALATSGPEAGGACAAFPGVAATWLLTLAEPIVVLPGAAVRMARRQRVSSYRASDGRWYLGIREWNGALGRFNTVQPVAGPLRPYAGDPARAGFRLEWLDAGGALLDGSDPARVAGVVVTTRGESVRPVRVLGLHSSRAPYYEDSLHSAITFRNRR